MKNLIYLSTFLFLFPFFSHGQKNCLDVINKAEQEINNNLKKALKLLQDAEICDYKNKHIKKRQKIQNEIFAAISKQKQDAVKAKAEAEVQRDQAEKERNQKDDALEQKQVLIDAFYFYDDKYALANNENFWSLGDRPSFHFINKKGEKIDKLGDWEKAEQFNEELGLAKVKNETNYSKEFDFLIDTLGNQYKVAYSLEHLDTSILALDLRGTQLDSFPSEIINNTQLEIIILNSEYPDSNTLNIPPNINNLKDLKIFSAKSCQIANIPKEIGDIESLEVLLLSDNLLKEIPNEIGHLSDLQILDLNKNKIDSLPNDFGNLEKLWFLDLKGNNFDSFPIITTDLISLKEFHIGSVSLFNIKGKQINKIPFQIKKLKSLEHLEITGTYIKTLPKEIKELENLKTLNLNHNQIISLPNEIGEIKKLENLILSVNNLKTLPESIGNLKELKKLILSNSSFTGGSNKLENLPSSIGELKKLEILDLSLNNLEKLPVEIGGLESLKQLNLGGNSLKILPNEIGDLENLESLIINSAGLSSIGSNSNNIKTLPKTIGNLYKLRELNLHDLPLKELPAEIGNLKNLKSLTLSGAFISSLDEVTIAKPRLLRLPPEIGNLESLTTLNLNNNEIKEIPKEIGNLKSLEWLGLNKNNIKTLPDEIKKLNNLNTLFLNDNPIADEETERISNLLPQCEIMFPNSFAFFNDRALKAFELKDYNKALFYFLKVIDNETTLTLQSAYYNTALCYLNLGDDKNTLKYLKIYRKSNPNTEWIDNTLANIYIKQQKWHKLPALQLTTHIEISIHDEVAIEEIPKEIFQLKRLKSLNINFNMLKSIPAEIKQLDSLNYLNVASNEISKLPEELKELKYLETLVIEGNPISESDLNHYNEIYNTNTPHSDAWDNLIKSNSIKVLHNQGKYLEAYSEMKKLIARADAPGLWFDLSFYSLFVNKPQEAINAAKRTLELDSSQTGVNSNLALGYLLNNQWNEAEKIYLSWKGKSFPDFGSELCDELFLQDIKDLEKASITHPDFKKVKQLFKKE